MTIRRPALVSRVLGVALLASSCTDATTPASPSAPSPVTAQFDGQFAVGGGATRTFTASEAGTVTVLLSAIGPPSNVVVGLGIGIPRADKSGCSLNQSIEAAAGVTPQVTATIDAGNYCARVYDVGNLSSQVAFSITIVHP